jgi:hypothetical protein
MKKIILCLPLILLLIAPACKNGDYTCVCTVSGGTTGGYTVQNDSYKDDDKADAIDDCSSWMNEQQANLQQAGGTGTVNCVLEGK